MSATLKVLGVHEDEQGPYVHVRHLVPPGIGPPPRARSGGEGLTVRHGTLGYQRAGHPPRTAAPGETVAFRRGEAHRVWNAGPDVLECDGWIGPPGTLRGLFRLAAVPARVQRVLLPLIVALGRVLGWHRRFLAS